MTKNKDYVRLTIGMSADFKKRLRQVASSYDMTMSEYILNILQKSVLDAACIAAIEHIAVDGRAMREHQKTCSGCAYCD